jgi:hypothetical protein
MKFLFNVCAVLTAALIITSCKTTDEPQATKAIDLTVKLLSPRTRADVAAVPTDGYQSYIQLAHMFVLDYQDNVIANAAFTGDEITAAVKTIATTTAAHDVLIVANFPSSFVPGDFSALTQTDIEAALFALDDLAPEVTTETDGVTNDHGVKYAMMYNVEENSIVAPVADGDPYTVTVKIAPVVARIEIAQAAGTKAMGEDTGYPIKSYTLSGVYLNNVYPSIKLSGYVTAAGTKIEGEDLSGRDAWNHDVLGGTEYEGDLTYTPANGVWAYHIAPTDGAVADVPHIVLHLTDVIFDDGSAGGLASPITDLYVVVGAYKDSNEANLTEFERGKIYKITSITFNEPNLVTTPDPADVNLTATVDIVGWEFVAITPNI